MNILDNISNAYSLNYGVEAILPLECWILSLKIAIYEWLTNKDNVKLYLQELETPDKKQLKAQ